LEDLYFTDINLTVASQLRNMYTALTFIYYGRNGTPNSVAL